MLALAPFTRLLSPADYLSDGLQGNLASLPSTVKRYHDDPAKERSRVELRKIAAEEILSRVSPERCEVLCLGGVDLQEIHSVYDPLGIPRHNITVLERDAEIADAIESHQSGVRLQRKTVLEYARSPIFSRAHIISLDYTGPLTEEDLNSITILARKNTAKRYLFHQANSARRDRNSYLHYVQIPFPSTNKSVLDNYRAANAEGTAQLDALQGARLRKTDVTEERSAGFSAAIMQALSEPILIEDLPILIQLSGFDSDFAAKMEREFLRLHPEASSDNGSASRGAVGALQSHLQAAIENHLIESGLSVAEARTVFEALLIQVTNRFANVPIRMERYSYVSESWCPMIGDILVLERSEPVVATCQSLGSHIKRTGCIPEHFHSILHDQIGRIDNQWLDLQEMVLSQDRKFLGSSAKPLLTKKRAIDELKQGASIAEIRRKYRGASNKPLSQWKAHVTMGTYDDKEATLSPEDELGTADAIALLREGIPVSEVLEAYPGCLSQEQVDAFIEPS